MKKILKNFKKWFKNVSNKETSESIYEKIKNRKTIENFCKALDELEVEKNKKMIKESNHTA